MENLPVKWASGVEIPIAFIPFFQDHGREVFDFGIDP